jgi:hypothetical protein
MLGWQGVKMEAVYLCNSSGYCLTCLVICSNSCRSFCAWSLLHLVRHHLSSSIKRGKRAFYLCNYCCSISTIYINCYLAVQFGSCHGIIDVLVGKSKSRVKYGFSKIN